MNNEFCGLKSVKRVYAYLKRHNRSYKILKVKETTAL